MDKNNYMFLNGKKVNIGKIELDRKNLFVEDKTGKYSFSVTVTYDWKKINTIEVGKISNVNFNEYIFGYKNESVLIWPDICTVEKLSQNEIVFNLEFQNIDENNDTCYMNKKGCFDIPLSSLKVRAYINYNDAKDEKILYQNF